MGLGFESQADHPKVAARCSASAATFFVLGARDWAAYLSPFLQGKRTLNSVFCKNRGYNRKNLYPERLLIAVFCILGWLEIALTYALAGISRYDDGHLFLSDNLDSISLLRNVPHVARGV